MAKKETITIGNELFTVNNGFAAVINDAYGRDNRRDEIYRAYAKPSVYKVAIWNEWLDWAIANGAFIHINSYNCQIFTIGGYIMIDNVGWFNICITKTRHELTKVK